MSVKKFMVDGLKYKFYLVLALLQHNGAGI
jgi:hypothetical protein